MSSMLQILPTIHKRTSVESRLLQFLFQYRITPHTTTGLSPAEFLMGRRLRSQLSLLHPGVEERVKATQETEEVPLQRGKRTVIRCWRSCLGSQLQQGTKMAKWCDLRNPRSHIHLGGVVRWGQSEKAL